MATCFLRFEGVNLETIVRDTQDLSTSRGGSLLLLNVIDAIEACLRLAHQEGELKEAPTPLSRGASIGVFSLILTERTSVKSFREKVEGWTSGRDLPPNLENRHHDLLILARHGTFVVDIFESPEEKAEAFDRVHERLLSANRLRRMQTPNLTYPAEDQRETPVDLEGLRTAICSVDLARPAMPELQPFKGGKQAVSRSVWQRRTYGRAQKSKMYASIAMGYELPSDFEHRYAQDLHEIGELSSGDKQALNEVAEANEEQKQIRRLDGKVAVFYADGNAFSKIRGRLTATYGEKGLETWDSSVRSWRQELMATLLTFLHARGSVAYTVPEQDVTKKCLRLETLLWGGDELVWVVPAWLGIDVASLFFAVTKSATHRWRIDGSDLHHAGGLVFCRCNAPIHRIIALARQLAGTAKSDRSRSLLAYEVLESFDFIADRLGQHRERRASRMGHQDWLINARSWSAEGNSGPQRLKEAWAHLQASGVARRQIYRLAETVSREGDSDRYRKQRILVFENLPKSGRDHWQKAVNKLSECLSAEPWLWLHLEALFDYLPRKALEPTLPPGNL